MLYYGLILSLKKKSMKIEDLFSVFKIEDLKDLPVAVMALIEGDREKRDEILLVAVRDV